MMKTTLFLFAWMALGLSINSCNAQNRQHPDRQVVDAFKARYPQARHPEWETKQGFHVAEFHTPTAECEAWFDNNGKWTMTKSELAYQTLPATIRNSIEKSAYGNWKKDDVTKIERPDATPIYIIEVENNKQETDLYYTEDGRLLKSLQDLAPGTPADYSPVPDEIRNQITRKYPQAILIDSDRKKGKYEVDILDRGINKEVLFNGTTWESTRWEVNPADVPAAVLNTFRQANTGNYRIDDIRFIETPTNAYYRFEIEQDDRDTYLSIDSQGKLIK